MLELKSAERKLSSALSMPKIQIDYIVILSFALLILVCLYPEISLASSFEKQLDTTGTLIGGKGKTIGITIATVLVTIVSIVKGNLKLAGGAVGTGLIAALYLEWVAAGMKIMT